MAREGNFKTRMDADTANLMTILPGKVYVSGGLTVQGIHPDTTADAFDAQGNLRPCALVCERAEVPDGWVRDLDAQMSSTIQVVEIYVYERRGWTAIDAALDRLYGLFEGKDFDDGGQVECVNLMRRLPREAGALKNSSVGRIDFAVYFTRGVS